MEFGEINERRMLLLIQSRKGQELQMWSADFKLMCSLKVEFDEENVRLKKLQIPKDERFETPRPNVN